MLLSDANNCGCNEHQNVPSWGPPQTTGKLKFGKGPLTDGLYHYQSEVQATIDFGFDGIKLDGCGEFLNLTVFADLMNKTGKAILIELKGLTLSTLCSSELLILQLTSYPHITITPPINGSWSEALHLHVQMF